MNDCFVLTVCVKVIKMIGLNHNNSKLCPFPPKVLSPFVKSYYCCRQTFIGYSDIDIDIDNCSPSDDRPCSRALVVGAASDYGEVLSSRLFNDIFLQ